MQLPECSTHVHTLICTLPEEVGHGLVAYSSIELHAYADQFSLAEEVWVLGVPAFNFVSERKLVQLNRLVAYVRR